MCEIHVAGRPWNDAERLQEIALQLQRSGHIVVEGPASKLLTEPKPAGLELPPLPQVFGSAMWEGAADEQVLAPTLLAHNQATLRNAGLHHDKHRVLILCSVVMRLLGFPLFPSTYRMCRSVTELLITGAADLMHAYFQEGASGRGGSLKDHVQRESLERYLTSRIQGVGPGRAAQLVEAHGVDILRHLDSMDAELAIKKLSAISGVGRKTAEQMLRSWTLNPKRGMLLCSCVLDGGYVHEPGTLLYYDLHISPVRAQPLLRWLLAGVWSHAFQG